jgi:hypothetical protein
VGDHLKFSSGGLDRMLGAEELIHARSGVVKHGDLLSLRTLAVWAHFAGETIKIATLSSSIPEYSCTG